MKDFKWNFPLKRKEDKGIAPIQKVFFSKDNNTAVPEVTESLVREAIQNSLDAQLSGTERPMHIRFSISSNDNRIPFDRISKYLDGLIPHLESKGADIPGLPQWNESVPFLTVEDFNTHGLRGDIHKDMTDNPSDDFCYFWRNLVGFTGKGGNERGKWGIGKAVYPASSSINTFFGTTIRDPEEGPLLMGLSVLNLHRLEEDSENYFVPYGDFGVSDEENANFILPVSGENVNRELMDLFNCSRTSETGLSLMIPYPDPLITSGSLILSTIQQYYYPLLRGKLEVTVARGSEEIIIDRHTLTDVLSDLVYENPEEELEKQWNAEIVNLKTICEFARWASTVDEKDFTCLTPLPEGNLPTWNKSLFKDVDQNKLRDRYHNGERIAIKVPLYVKKAEDEEGKQCWFKVFLWNDVAYKDIFAEYIREDLTIPEINPDLRESGIKALVIVESDFSDENRALATMVGLSENPSHTRWDKNSGKFRKAGYVYGEASLSFIINSLNRLCKRYLQKPMEDVDDTILADLFPIFEEDRPEPPEDEKPGPEKPEDPGMPVPEARPRKLLLSRNSDGFRIIKNPDSKKLLRTLDIAAGYRLKRGNAISKHRTEDFDFNTDIFITNKGLKEQKKDKNRVKYIITDQDFEIKMEGFDVNRDLEVSYTAFEK